MALKCTFVEPETRNRLTDGQTDGSHEMLNAPVPAVAQ